MVELKEARKWPIDIVKLLGFSFQYQWDAYVEREPKRAAELLSAVQSFFDSIDEDKKRIATVAQMFFESKKIDITKFTATVKQPEPKKSPEEARLEKMIERLQTEKAALRDETSRTLSQLELAQEHNDRMKARLAEIEPTLKLVTDAFDASRSGKRARVVYDRV